MAIDPDTAELVDIASRHKPSLALLGDRFEAVARVRQGAIAIVDGERRMSYRELLLRADGLAGELQARGVGPRDLVGIALPRSAELVVAMVGIVRAGAAYVPIDLNNPAERRALILSDARPKLVVTEGGEVEGIPLGIERLRLPHDVPEGILPRQRPQHEDPAYVIYTSGSTGQPKGVVVVQRNVARLFTITEPLYKFDANDVWILFHSIGFDVSVWELWGALLHGGRLVVVPALTARAADAFHALVIREGVTVLCQTPSAFRAFDAVDAAAGRPANHLRQIVFAGEALDPRSLKGWFEAHGDEQPRVANMYGPTETTVYATYRRILAGDADGPGRSFIGVPLADLRVDLLGPDSQPVATGEVGEIFVAGEGVTAGYLGRPDLTAERFLPDPRGGYLNARLYRSGDLGRSMPDGDIEYLGRIDNQVKLRGFRIELGEIEAALRKAAGVRDAVVALRNNAIKGPELVAYVVQVGDTLPEPLSLREHVAHYLPEYMVPAAYVRIKHIPRTINDKINRTALPQPTAADYASTGAGAAPRDDLERAVAQIFSDVLDIDVTAREADFFRLGGDSLLALRVVIRCQERLSVELSMGSIFDHPTVAALADVVRHERNLKRAGNRIARIPRGGTIPLSAQQYALWLDLKIRHDRDTYNEALAFRIKERLEPERVVRALGRLAQVHEVLRARLIEVGGEPRLVTDRSAAAIECEFVATERSDETLRKLTEASHRPFNLTEGPLWRAMICHEADGGSVLLLVIHHIIVDAASQETLLRDLVANYVNPDTSRAPSAYDFGDLAAHEHACLASEGESLERFWAANLDGANLALDLPLPCVPCKPEAADASGSSRRQIGPVLTRRVRDLAASWGLTPFHIYLTAYLALLRTYTTSDELVIGSPVSLRDTPAAEGVVGYLLSPAAFRAHLAGDRSFRETAGDVARRWQQVRMHARLPMHLALRATPGAPRTGVGSPVQICFSLVRDPGESLLINGHALQQIYIPPAHVKFNLFLLVEERQEEASLLLEFRRETLDPEMADRLLRHFEVLLSAATQDPESTLAKLPLTARSELVQLREWGTHSEPYPRDRTVVDIFEEVAHRQKDKTALVAGGDRISYEDLDRRANAVAAMLRKAGVREGDRVPLLLRRGSQFIIGALGVMKCGAAYVPLDPAYPPERTRRMIEGLDARIGLTGAGLFPANSALNWLDANSVDDLASLGAKPREGGPEDCAYVMFTSGSTGRPKGVAVPHRAIVRLIFGQDFVRMGPAETWLHMAPTAFDASTLEIWAPLLHGGCCIIAEETPTPRLLGEIIQREGVTSAWITSSLFNVIVDEAPMCLSGLTQLLIGGEALSPSHVRRALDLFPGIRLVNGYGPTENTTFTCCHVIGRNDVEPGRTIPIGRPIANTTVYVLDSDGRPAPVGVPGELVAGGDGVALGYIGQTEKTEQLFLPDRFSGQPGARLYRSGDRVRWRPEGVIEFLGRFDSQIKIRGHRVEPGEVAAVLAEHEAVSQAVVIPHLATTGAKELVALVVAKGKEHSVPELSERLVRYCTECLPPYMLPAKVLFLQELPLNPNGKLEFAALQDAVQNSVSTQGDAPLSLIGSKILGIMREILRDGELGPDEDFFEAGGDSLLAIRLMLRLESEFEKTVSLRSMSDLFTARRLAAHLDNPAVLTALFPPGVVKVGGGTTGRPLFCLPGLGSAFSFRALAAKMRTSRPILGIELHDLDVGPSVLQSIEKTAAAVVARMREVQPVGPYAILGYSYGGNVAIEVARALIATGQNAELVMLLDAYVPSLLPKGLDKAAVHLRSIAQLNLHQVYKYFSTRIQHRLAMAFPRKSEVEQRVVEAMRHCLHAYYAHRPEPFSGHIVLLRSPDLGYWRDVADPSGSSGWNSICKGGVDIIPMTCGHYEFFKEPYVTDVAMHIDELLDTVDNS